MDKNKNKKKSLFDHVSGDLHYLSRNKKQQLIDCQQKLMEDIKQDRINLMLDTLCKWTQVFLFCVFLVLVIN